MATRKQVVVGLLMFLTVLIMLFFMTSDFSFSLSFRANSHPLKIKDEKERVHPKFFGSGGDVEVMVYKGKDGEVVPEGLVPQPNDPPKVIVINTDDEKTMDEITDEIREAESWMIGDDTPEFPKVEINHEVDVKPAEPTEGTTQQPLTTIKSSTSVLTTPTTTSTTSPTPTTSTETSSTYSPDAGRSKMKGNEVKMEVKKRHLGNMAHVTTETEPQLTTSSSVSASPPIETQADHDPVTESPGKQASESPAVESQETSLPATGDSSASEPATPVPRTRSQTEITEQGESKQSITETPKTETTEDGTLDVSHNQNSTNYNNTAAASKAGSDFDYQINKHQNQDQVFIEHNDLPEEFLSDDLGSNSKNSLL